MPTVTQDSKITRDSFNDLVEKFNSIWTDDASGQMFTPRATQNPNYTWANKGWGALTGRLGTLANRMTQLKLTEAGMTWASGQNYLVGQLILHNAVIWLSKSDHTSAPSNAPNLDPNTWYNYETDPLAEVQQHLDNTVTYADWSIFGNAVNAALIHCGLPIIPSTALPEQFKLVRGITHPDDFYYNMVATKIDQMYLASTASFVGDGTNWTTNGTTYYRGITRKMSASAEISRYISLTTTAGWGVNDYRTYAAGPGSWYPNFKYNNVYGDGNSKTAGGDPVWANSGRWQVAFVRLEFDNQTKLRHFLNQGGTVTIYPYYTAGSRTADVEWQNIVNEVGSIELGGMSVRRVAGPSDSGSVSRDDYLKAYGDGGVMSEYVGSGGGSAQGAWKTWVSAQSNTNAYWEDTTPGTMTYSNVWSNQHTQNYRCMRRRYCSSNCGGLGANYVMQILENGSPTDTLTQKFSTANDSAMPVEYYQGGHRYTRGAEQVSWTETIPNPFPGGGADTVYQYREWAVTKDAVGFSVGSEEDYAGPNPSGEQFLNLGSTPLLSTGNYGQGARRRLEVVSRIGPGGGDNWYLDCGIRLFNKSENKYDAQIGIKGYYTNVNASIYPEAGGVSTTVVYPISFAHGQDSPGTGAPPVVTALDSAAGTW